MRYLPELHAYARARKAYRASPCSRCVASTLWTRVALFYAVACVWSWPLFFWRDVVGWGAFPLSPSVGMFLIMWGPGVAALVCWRVLGPPAQGARARLLGSSPTRAVLALCAVLLALVAPAWWGNGDAIAPLLLVFPLALARTFGEELGWRGYLQETLGRVPRTWRYVLVGVLWETWHFTTRTYGRPFPQVLFVLVLSTAVAIAASFALGWAVERSGSILVAVAGHALMNIALEAAEAGAAAQAWAALAAIGIVVMLLAAWPPLARDAFAAPAA